MAETYSRRPARFHPVELKREVVEEVLSGQFSLNSIARHYEISRTLIKYWVGQYHRGELENDIYKNLLMRNTRLERLVSKQAIELDTLREIVASL